jgi:hypothetical protein
VFQVKEEVVVGAEEEKKTESVGRTRKLSSWVAPNIFTESKAVEKLLGLFQNPFSRGGGGSGGVGGQAAPPPLNNNEAGPECGATWPLRLLSPPHLHQASSATSAPSLIPYSPGITIFLISIIILSIYLPIRKIYSSHKK